MQITSDSLIDFLIYYPTSIKSILHALKRSVQEIILILMVIISLTTFEDLKNEIIHISDSC
jgi:hypothetical protein